MTKIAFSTLACPDWTWFDVLKYGPRYGYDGVEIRQLAREVDLLKVVDLQAGNLARRRRELVDAGFAVCGLASSVRFDFPDANRIHEQIETGKAYVNLAAELGARFVRVFGDVLPADVGQSQKSAALSRIGDGLNWLGEYAEKFDIDILLETHGDFSNSHHVMALMSMPFPPTVGILWDTHHPWRFCGEELTETFDRIGKWVRHTHWKDSVAERSRPKATAGDDAARQAHSLMSGHREANYVLFGEGEFSSRHCLQLLSNAGYQGWYSLEWEKMWHPELDEPDVALPHFAQRFRELLAADRTDA